MKFFKYKLLVVSLFISGFSVAQEKEDSAIIKKDIIIEKAYIPNIKESGKINDIPPVVEPEIKQKPVIYSDYSTLIDTEYELRPLESARVKNVLPQNTKDGLLRLGFGFCWYTLADLVCPIVKTSKYNLGVNVNHNGFWGDKMHHKTLAGINFSRYFKSGELFLKARYAYEGFKYYGGSIGADTAVFNFKGTENVTKNNLFNKNAGINTFGATLGYKSIPNHENMNRFSAVVNYDGFIPNLGLSEHLINTNLGYEHDFDENYFGVAFKMHNYIFGDKNLGKYATSTENFTYVGINPYFTFDQNRWNLRIGLNADFSSQGQAIVPSADIFGQFEVVKNTLFLYAGIQGGYETNSMRDMVNYNHYFNLNKKIENTYNPLNISGGLKLKILYNLLMDVSVRYKILKNQYFFVSELNADSTAMANIFGMEYTDASVFTPSIRINYNYNQVLSFIFSGKYNKWDVDDINGKTMKAYQMPKFEFDLGTTLHIGKSMSAYLNAYIATGRQARIIDTENGGFKDVDMKSMIDINLGFNYVHSSRVALFIKLNNIIHRKHEVWYGYPADGINGLIGLTFSF